MRKLLMISTDRKIFQEGSAVRARQVEYAKEYDEVHIVVFNQKVESGKWKVELSSNCFAYRTNSSLKFLYPFDAIRIGSDIIKQKGITEITCQDASLTAMAGVNLKKRFRIPLEIQIHEDIGSSYYPRTATNKIRKKLALKYLPQADSIRVVSNRIKEFLVKSLSIQDPKIEVRPIFVDTDKIKNAPISIDLHKKYPQFEKIVLMSSRLEPEKDIELAINSWPEVLMSAPKAGLIIVGEGSRLNELKTLVNKLGLSSNVMFEPWADLPTLYSYYKTADVFLVTSFFEGYGMSLVEAHASGSKIVTTDVGAAREIGGHIVEHTVEDVALGLIKELMS